SDTVDSESNSDIVYLDDELKQKLEGIAKNNPEQDSQRINTLGCNYLSGTTFKKNYKKARIWFEFASCHDNIDSLFQLGLIYEKGLDVNADHTKAIEYYSKAANIDHQEAQLNLGRIYLHEGSNPE